MDSSVRCALGNPHTFLIPPLVINHSHTSTNFSVAPSSVHNQHFILVAIPIANLIPTLRHDAYKEFYLSFWVLSFKEYGLKLKSQNMPSFTHRSRQIIILHWWFNFLTFFRTTQQQFKLSSQSATGFMM